jgi:hypothetical protein
MLINCGHEQVRLLTPDMVNTESGLNPHRFNWLSYDVMGALPITGNYLEWWHTPAECEDPTAVHFMRGGTLFEQWRHVDYGAEWLAHVSMAMDFSGRQTEFVAIRSQTHEHLTVMRTVPPRAGY